jgi:hypothetical protein
MIAASELGPSSLTISSIVRDLRESSSNNRRRISDVRGVVRSRFPVFNRAAVRFCLVAPDPSTSRSTFRLWPVETQIGPDWSCDASRHVRFIVRCLERCQEKEPGART